MTQHNLKIQEWNQSYSRKENYIFYPKEESVKFINRFVRKQIGADRFRDVIYQDEIHKSEAKTIFSENNARTSTFRGGGISLLCNF